MRLVTSVRNHKRNSYAFYRMENTVIWVKTPQLKSDVRIVAATNQTIESLTGSENFRIDLYYRLETHHIHLPPLRDRKGDIPLLVSHFLKRAAAALNKKKRLPLHRNSLHCSEATTSPETLENLRAW